MGLLAVNGEILSTEASGPARIVIAEDHPVFREALRQIVNMDPELEVVGEAKDGIEAVELCRRLQPKLVLMDLGMPRMDGLEATKAIKSEFSLTIVLVLTASMEMGFLSDAIKAGAAGYILKDASSQEIIEAIRRVLRGESPLNQELAMGLLLRRVEERPKEERESTFASSTQRPSEERSAAALVELLSPREIDVLRLVAQGQTNRQIAQVMLVSLSSVKAYVGRIIDKLGVSDRTQAAVRAVELGLISDQHQKK